jgi:8-oxo-dGTP diphosphatase
VIVRRSVAAPSRLVSAALTVGPTFGLGERYLAPGDEFPLLRGRFRVVALSVAEWRAVLVAGPYRSGTLEVRLTPTDTGTLVTCSATVPRPLRRRALELLSSMAQRIVDRAQVLVDAPVVVGAVIVCGRTLLAQQRAYPPAAAGLWELPGGRVEPGESEVDAVRRECQEELGVDVVVGAPVGPDVALQKGRVLRLYTAPLADDRAVPHPHDHADLRWLSAGQLASVPWLPADRVVLPTLRRML